MSELKRKHAGELRRVRCKVCREVLNYQSYPKHLGEKGSQTRAGRLQAERVAKLDVEKVVDVMKTRTDSIVPFLHTGLSKVYSSTERAQIESIRTLLNLQLFTRVVERLGAVNTATIHFKRWVDSAKLLQLLILIALKELSMKFQCFLRKLEKLEKLAPPTLLNQENRSLACSFTPSSSTSRASSL